MVFKLKFVAFFLCIFSILTAQVAPKKLTSADIFDQIKKLQVLGSVLYVAAHPDDENTRMISYFANARHMDITYLSLTRGDGGQNLIGSELREMLGVLRTQELLMARATDGGKQLFSRANDFGFSKSPAETFRIWGKEAVLSDVVWAFRRVQPDIVINRFSIDTAYDTHGHHTGSAILSSEAFDISGTPSVFPEQLKHGVAAWQPRRLLHNISWWWFGSQDKFDAYVKKEQTMSLDAGVFLPTRGKSNDEIAAESRSMHKCQAMGMMSSRGSNLEYLQYLKGAKGDNKATKDPFEGINTSWSRLDGGAPIGQALAELEKKFDVANPSKSVVELVRVMRMMEKLPAGNWRDKKLADIQKVILLCAGVFAEATSKDFVLTANGKTEVLLEILNRSDANVALKNVQVTQRVGENFDVKTIKDTSMTLALPNNQRKNFKFGATLDFNAAPTTPYWLNETSSLGLYTVNQQTLRGLPETPRTLEAHVTFTVEGAPIQISLPVVHVYANPAKGEIYRPLEVTPSVFVNIADKAYVFAENAPKDVSFIVKSGAENVLGRLQPVVPKGWKIEPEIQEFSLKLKGEETILTYRLTPPQEPSEGLIKAQALLLPKLQVMDNVDFQPVTTKSVKNIEYDHIPTQTVLLPAESKIVKLNVEKRGNQIGYFMGAGDDMPACLEQIGYNVTQLSDFHFQNINALSRFDAIVVGIRAYNTKEKLKFYNQKLLDYVKNGGTIVVQYNTSGRDLVLPQFGPYPFKLGRGRTTEEDSEVRFLIPNHPALNTPNKITQKDFSGWVQERGLYFLTEWDAQYEAVLSCNDTNEKPEDGGLMVAKYGKGYYVYTGFSFFRELPAGVPGAYRLFANLLSLGKQVP